MVKFNSSVIKQNKTKKNQKIKLVKICDCIVLGFYVFERYNQTKQQQQKKKIRKKSQKIKLVKI